jgi:hypothetical protein
MLSLVMHSMDWHEEVSSNAICAHGPRHQKKKKKKGYVQVPFCIIFSAILLAL